MALNESGEMYLESILVLSKKNNMVRSVDVAEYMQLSKPAVSRAIGKLKAERYILVDADGHIALTESGREIASSIYERHIFLTRFLIKLGVDEETAKADACKMEHDISEQTYTALCRHAIGKLGILGEDDAGLGETAGTDEN